MTESDGRNEERRRPGFLIWVSGARQEVLDRCPTERIKFQTLGWAILITCAMATVSMWFALTSAMGFNPVLSLPVAILWGLIIMGIDRWLVTSMPPDGKRKFLIAAPRLALAILLGSLISTPIVLRIFESEINNQISIIKAQNEAAFLTSTEHSSIQAAITKWQKAVDNYQQVIDSKGAVQIDPAADPTVQDLNSQLTAAKSDATTDYKAWQCQLYGGCNAPKGNGPLAAASHQRYLNDEARITSLQGQIQAREQTLQTNNESSQASRFAQAQKALPGAQGQLNAAQTEENALTSNFQGTNNAANGLLIRLKALDQLAAGSSTLQTARVLLFLLFLFIEILPVTVKLFQPKGNYEKILLQEIEQELAKADWEMRADFVEPAAMFRSPGDVRLGNPNGAAAAGRPGQRNPRDRLDAELAAVWEQHTRAEPVQGWEGRAGTEYLPVDDDSTGPHRLDDILRSMPDTRSTSAYEEQRQGGIERRYGDDDL
jgi:Domain of unknown function (DUF4407)